ncbi:glycosyl transferase, group 1 [Novosphingobium sp. Rr 2-17]|uniref:TIGR03087 family PEP-CTERM/XrtA system glycosyltransferase n=1 Tax=Novosphingobium sp. Rr 2-17 TaxID=555793 RepID=UPI00026991B3|nr:TIGR03087 family PEP-CTERM/XrtA system glycosyltransferase [Novosphingobium sp. Rr 2-17]EIZ80387.1 glycosyl transferase, group 1 [Novosphingobium sp. Rr 2-17]
MGDILFLSHRIPFPADRGDKIRSHNVLKALARYAPVHVATFADDAADRAYEPQLASLAASYRLVTRAKSLPRAGVEALVAGKPLSLTAFHHRAIEGYVRHLLASRSIDVIYVFSGQMAQYVPADFTGVVVADLVDVDSAKFEAYAQRSGGIRAWMERREARLLSAEEARIVAKSEVILLISEPEAALLQSRLPVPSQRVRTMGNGLDAAFFDPIGIAPAPQMAGRARPRIVFTGQMDYAPNIEAAMRAIERILPRVRAVLPEASFHVVGRNPSPALKAHDGRSGVHVWGRVDDIRPWLAVADCALVPLEIARGVQNKVLEAMAMALPVVLTPGAATGIPACDGRDFAVAESDDALAQAVIALAADPQRAQAMGRDARAWILAHASWEAALADLPYYLTQRQTALSDAA